MPSFYVREEDVVYSIVEQYTVEEFFKLVEAALDWRALADIDEELIARIWNKLKGVYMEGEELPTLDSLVKQYIG